MEFKKLLITKPILTDTNVNNRSHARLTHLHYPNCYYIRRHDVLPPLQVNLKSHIILQAILDSIVF